MTSKKFNGINKTPCKDCDRRQVGCHSTCPDYISFRKKRDELLEARFRERYGTPTYKYRNRKGDWK